MDQKQANLEAATDSLAAALKILSRFDAEPISAREIPRVLDAATQAAQAASHLNQLAGRLQAELEATR